MMDYKDREWVQGELDKKVGWILGFFLMLHVFLDYVRHEDVKKRLDTIESVIDTRTKP